MSFIFNKTPVLTNNESFKDIFYAIPIGIIIIDKDKYFSSSARILFANNYSRKILGIPKDNDMSLFVNKFSLFKEYDQAEKEGISLKEVLFKSKEKSITKVFTSPTKELVYVKIKRHQQKILVTIDDLQEERKLLQSKFVKSIGYEYLLTLYHEINNPLNSLIASVHEIIQKVESVSVVSKRIDLLACLIQFFLKNFISYFQVSIIDEKDEANNSTFNLDALFKQMSNKFSMLFEYKKIHYRSNLSLLNSKSSTMNYFFFKTLIKTIFTYFYHKADKGGHFSVSVEKVDNGKAKILFSNARKSESLTRSFSSLSDHERNKEAKQKNTIQTIEMMIKIMNKLSELLGLPMELVDAEITSVSLTVSYENQSKLLNEEEINELSPYHHQVFTKLSRVIPKFSLEDLNNFQPTPNILNEDKGSARRLSSKPFESFIKSRKKDLIKSLLKNIDMMNNNDNDNTETQRDTQSMQDYHNCNLYDSSDSSVLSQDSFSKTNNTLINESFSFIAKNSRDFSKVKGKKHFSFTSNNFQIISPRKKNGFSTKCLTNTHRNGTYRIVEAKPEEVDAFSGNPFRSELRKIRGIVLTDPNGKETALMRTNIPYSIGNMNNITEEDFEIESKANNLSFSRVNFQNIVKERVLYPPNKKMKTVPRGGFHSKEYTPQPSFPINPALVNNEKLGKDWTPKSLTSTSKSKAKCKSKCCDVLVVDDEQFNLSCLVNLLSQFNIHCDIATNGKECLEQVTKKADRQCTCPKGSYKLILLDILMPKVNGVDAAKEIIKRVNEGLLPSTLSIIFISACLDQESIVQDLNKEHHIVKEFISKPIKRSKIEDIIQKYYNCD